MSTGPGKHRHLDSRGKWTTDTDPPHVHSETARPADSLTVEEVAALRKLIEPPPAPGVSTTFTTA